jgi:hypothetical protein
LRKVGVFPLVAAAVLTLCSPVAAAADASAQYTANCPTGRIAARENEVPLTTGPHSISVVGVVQKGGQLSCIQGLYLGTERYTRCGVVNGNGYIAVYHTEYGVRKVRYTYQACRVDQ